MFIFGSGRQTAGLGPTVGSLALFIGPRNTYAVVAWAKTQATATAMQN